MPLPHFFALFYPSLQPTPARTKAPTSQSPHTESRGATGLVGRALVQELQEHAYQISVLALSEASVLQLQSQGDGVRVVRGSLDDLATLKAKAAWKDIDGVIHLAFIHKSDQYAQSSEVDAKAIAALGDGLREVASESEGRRNAKALVASSAVAVDAQGSDGVAREADAPLDVFRVEAKQLLWRRQCLAPTVHCDDDKAFVRILNNSTLTHWKAVYVYLITWSAVHPRDFASLYRLAFEAARKGKSIVYHGVDECRVPFKSIAETIARKTDSNTQLFSPHQCLPVHRLVDSFRTPCLNPHTAIGLAKSSAGTPHK
ncbi:hypothetical protein E3P77_00163 [Wallemia ichthyophaga]|nr:hypothetical protein E3P77_00163 [Wallemia ichthyophaga]